MVAGRPHGEDEQRILVSQLGLITREQAVRCAYTPSAIKYKLRRQEWACVHRGLYRVNVYPMTTEQALLAECLRSPGQTWASHQSAAWLHGLMPPPRQHAVVTTSRLWSGVTKVHHVVELSTCDRAVIRNVPATAIEKTLIDVAAEVPLAQLNHMIDEAITTRRTDVAKIEWRLRRVGGSGRAGSAAIRRALGPRRRDGQVDSHLEREFLNLLAEAGLPKPRIQYKIQIGSRRMFADFAFPEQRLIVEVMGYRWHGGKDRWEDDLLRSSELGSAGWRVIYVTAQQIRKQRWETIERLGRALGVRPLFVL